MCRFKNNYNIIIIRRKFASDTFVSNISTIYLMTNCTNHTLMTSNHCSNHTLKTSNHCTNHSLKTFNDIILVQILRNLNPAASLAVQVTFTNVKGMLRGECSVVGCGRRTKTPEVLRPPPRQVTWYLLSLWCCHQLFLLLHSER